MSFICPVEYILFEADKSGNHSSDGEEVGGTEASWITNASEQSSYKPMMRCSPMKWEGSMFGSDAGPSPIKHEHIGTQQEPMDTEPEPDTESTQPEHIGPHLDTESTQPEHIGPHLVCPQPEYAVDQRVAWEERHSAKVRYLLRTGARDPNPTTSDEEEDDMFDDDKPALNGQEVPVLLTLSVTLWDDQQAAQKPKYGKHIHVTRGELSALREYEKKIPPGKVYVPFIHLVGHYKSMEPTAGIEPCSIGTTKYYAMTPAQIREMLAWVKRERSMPTCVVPTCEAHTPEERHTTLTPHRPHIGQTTKKLEYMCGVPEAGEVPTVVCVGAPKACSQELKQYVLEVLVPIPTPTDNNCCYHALARCVNELIKGNEQGHKLGQFDVRKIVASHLQKCTKHITSDITVEAAPAASAAAAEMAMKRNQWGGTLEIEAFCHQHNIKCFLYGPQGKVWECINPAGHHNIYK